MIIKHINLFLLLDYGIGVGTFITKMKNYGII